MLARSGFEADGNAAAPHRSSLNSEQRFRADARATLARRVRSVGSDVAEVELTEELITAAMAKTGARVFVSPDRCFAFPDRLEDARASCTPKGRCRIGWVVSRGRRES